jgi:hypothetical protein
VILRSISAIFFMTFVDSEIGRLHLELGAVFIQLVHCAISFEVSIFFCLFVGQVNSVPCPRFKLRYSFTK